MNQRFIVFDMDGTLTDTLPVMVETMQRALEKCGFPRHAEPARVREELGVDLALTVRTLLPFADAAAHKLVTSTYAALYRGVEQELGLRLFPEVIPTLKHLRDGGHKLVIGTGKSRAGLDRVLPLLGIGPWFADSCTADESAHKPDPLMLELLLARNGVAREHAVMIGDTTFDVEMARRAGVRSIAVSSGTHSAEALAAAGAHHLVATLLEVPELLGA
jgi:phosphoglycolate phosphatase